MAVYDADVKGAATPQSDSDFREIVRRGAGQLASDQAGEDKVAAAEVALRRLVEAAKAEAKRRGWDRLHEDTVRAALRSLCPIYPFC